MSPHERKGFRPDIQGLRAIAVLSVVLFHAYAGKGVPGGFVGVDIFFVISGFLISRILFKENEQGRFTVFGFYRRRIRRIFPALLTVLTFTLAVGALVLSPRAYRELSGTSIATIFFLSNIAFEKLSGYFDGAMAYKPLLHTWSLAVEEQFYIVYPLIVWVVYRFWRRWTGMLLFMFALLSLGLSIWGSTAHPNGAFYLAPVRAFELLIGAEAAHYAPRASQLGQKVRDVMSLLGLAAIAASLIFIHESMVFPGAIVLVPCLGTAFVIVAGQDRTSLGGRLISFAPFVFFGDISYSLYLWHWPVISLTQNWIMGPLPTEFAVIIMILSIAAAYGSWRWIERPFIEGLPRLKVISFGVVSMACMALPCAIIFLLDGLPNRYNSESLTYFDAYNDFNPLRNRCHSDETHFVPYDNSCVFGAPGATPSVAVWADSHGGELVVALGDKLATEHDAVIEITASACPPVLGYTDRKRPNCERHNDDTVHRLASDPRIKRVVLAANFAVYSAARLVAFEQGLKESVSALRDAGKEVILVDPIPVFNFDVPTALGMISARGGDPRTFGMSLADYRAKNTPYLSLVDRVARETGARVISTSDWVCQGDFCPGLDDHQRVLYLNANHLSLTGARKLAIGISLNVNSSLAQNRSNDPSPLVNRQ